MRLLLSLILTAGISLVLSPRIDADHPLPGPHYLQCEARGDDVVLWWDGLFIDATVHSARLLRQGEVIAALEADAVSFRDSDVAPGRHLYALEVRLIAAGEEGKPVSRHECEVEVVLSTEVRCEVLGGIAIPPVAVITWDALPPELNVASIEVERNGVVIASLPADALGHDDGDISAGDYVYIVYAISSVVPVDPAELLPPPPLVVGDCSVSFAPPPIGGFVRGDANADGKTDLSDAVFTLVHLFQGGSAPTCAQSADANDSGVLDLSDAVFTVGFLFLGSAPPPAPHPGCGWDTTPDELSCDAFGPCFHPPPP